MRKVYAVFMLFAALVLLSSLKAEHEEGDCTSAGGPRKSGGPPSCYSGEPPLAMTCGTGGCHEDLPLNTGAAKVIIDLGGADSGYIPGQTYNCRVLISRGGLARGGFQLVALKNSDITTTPGVISMVDNVRTQIINAANPHSGGCPTQNKTWIEHTGFGIDDVVNDTISWPFAWQAPATFAGDITFYLCAVDANKDLDNTGDFVFTRTKVVPSLVSSVKDIAGNMGLAIYPNPVINTLNLKLAGGFEFKQGDALTVVNGLGQTVLKPTLNKSIAVESLSKGRYVLQFNRHGETLNLPFVKD